MQRRDLVALLLIVGLTVAAFLLEPLWREQAVETIINSPH